MVKLTTDKNDPNYSVLTDPNYVPTTALGKRLQKVREKYGEKRDELLKRVEEIAIALECIKDDMKPKEAKKIEKDLDRVRKSLDFDVRIAIPSIKYIKTALTDSAKIVKSCKLKVDETAAEIQANIDELKLINEQLDEDLTDLEAHEANVRAVKGLDKMEEIEEVVPLGDKPVSTRTSRLDSTIK